MNFERSVAIVIYHEYLLPVDYEILSEYLGIALIITDNLSKLKDD